MTTRWARCTFGQAGLLRPQRHHKLAHGGQRVPVQWLPWGQQQRVLGGQCLVHLVGVAAQQRECHGAAVARALGSRRALLPRAAGAFCALGMLQSDVRQDYLQVFLADLDRIDSATVVAGFANLERRAREALGHDGFGDGAVAIEREMDLRYDGQQWPVRVATGAAFDPSAARRAFESGPWATMLPAERATLVWRLGDLLDRAAGTMLHVELERVSPLAVPVLVMIGRESVAQGSTDDALLTEAESLAATAMRAD